VIEQSDEDRVAQVRQLDLAPRSRRNRKRRRGLFLSLIGCLLQFSFLQAEHRAVQADVLSLIWQCPHLPEPHFIRRSRSVDVGLGDMLFSSATTNLYDGRP
jgi:hypothetical protein